MKQAQQSLELLHQAAIAFQEAQSLEKVCKVIVETGRKIFSSDHGSLFLYERDRLERVYTTSHELKKYPITKNGYVMRSFRTGKIVVLTNTDISEYKKIGIQSAVFVPFFEGKKKVGMLVLQSFEPVHFTKNDKQMLELYISLVCLAVMKFIFSQETQKALDVRDRFIALASHELRTPLTSINGYIQLLYSKLMHEDTLIARWVSELYNESIRLTNLVKELLDINRIKQGQFVFQLREVAMKDVVESVLTQVRSQFSNRTILFEDKTFDNRYRIVGDSEKLQQMLISFVTSIVSFSSSKQPIRISLAPTKRTIVLHIKDFSHEMSKEKLKKMFEGFSYKQNMIEKHGLGIDLSYAQYVVSFHKGTISLIKTKKYGQVIQVVLPLLTK